ncbi:hypothetical protein IFM89_016440 [Coptis chinensis]|uniref:Uncharacterized protein n=1 Tax=Coptis chinensis TaxID=261450 RepID=A0A835GZK9_9MAGN|nr:hypothetical protein IFM89_016440 [Coptis chinensis]
MVKRRREDPNGDENGGKWVRGTSTLPKVFNNPSSSKLKLTWNGNNQPDGPDTHPNLFAESMGVLMTSSYRIDLIGLNIGSNKVEMINYGYGTRLRISMVISQRNKRNRSKQIAKHTSGRKDWLIRNKSNNNLIVSGQIREEGAPPSQGDFFVLSHTSRKTNDALDRQSREYIEKMKELAGRDENGNQQPLSDEIYRQVMPRERHGCVRLMGRGVTPTSYFGSQASSHGTTFDRVVELENEMAEMRRVAQEKEEERQRELDEINRGFNARYEAMEARFMETLMQRTSLFRML